MSDRADVCRTLHAYCRLLDERQLAELVETVYTADASDHRRRGEPLRGREQIRGYFERAFAHLRATAHILTNVDVDVVSADGVALATSRVTAYHWDLVDTGPAADFVLLGTYTDRLRRTGTGWQIESRVVSALGPTGLATGTLPAVFAGFGGRA